MADERRRREEAFDRMEKDWAHGSAAYRREGLARLSDLTAKPSAALEMAAAEGQHWQACLEAGAKILHQDLNRAAGDARSAPWKIALADWLKGRTGVLNRWLGDRLQMGSPDAVSRYVGEARRGRRPEAAEIAARLAGAEVPRR
jgi:hypothetical protein